MPHRIPRFPRPPAFLLLATTLTATLTAGLIGGLIAALPAPAAADGPVMGHAPVYHQIVAFPLPAPFDPAPDYEAEQDGRYLLENVPPGETVEDWSQMLTLAGARGAAAQAGYAPARLAEAEATRLAHGYRAACAGPVEARVLEAPRGGVARASFAAYLGCPHVAGTDHAEEMLVLVLVGAQDLYTLHWSQRSPATDRLTMGAVWAGRLAQFGQAGLCDRRPGEAAPYPSCSP